MYYRNKLITVIDGNEGFTIYGIIKERLESGEKAIQVSNKMPAYGELDNMLNVVLEDYDGHKKERDIENVVKEFLDNKDDYDIFILNCSLHEDHFLDSTIRKLKMLVEDYDKTVFVGTDGYSLDSDSYTGGSYLHKYSDVVIYL